MATNNVNVSVTAQDKFSGPMNDARGNADGFGSSLKTMGKIGVAAFAALGAAAAGAGIALFKVGESFDEAFDTIRVGTGATGDSLEELKDDFRAVFAEVPVGAGEAGTAIADLNTRLGLTGEPLQDMAERFLNLSRITGTEVAGNIASLTRVFGDWDVAAHEQADTLDLIFRASQATGLGVDKLGESVVQFGAPLRQMGFGLEESVALLGQWEKEGVNTEAVLGALKIGVANFAKEGIDGREGLEQFVEQVLALGEGSEATSLAVETFGSRAGPDMAAAVLEGRFSIEEMVKTIESGSETINQAAEDTDSFGESWQLFKNNAMLAVEPVATRVFDKLGEGAAWMTSDGIPAAEHYAAVFERDVLPVLKDVADFIKTEVIPRLQDFAAFIENDVIPTATELAEKITEVVRQDIVPVIEEFRDRAIEEFNKFIDYWNNDLKPAWENIRTFVTFVVGEVIDFIDKHWPEIERIIKPILDNVILHFETVFGVIKNTVELIVDLIQGDWKGAWQNAEDIVDTLREGMIGTFTNILKFLGGIARAVKEAAVDVGEDLVNGIVDGIRNLGGAIEQAIRDQIPDSINVPLIGDVSVPDPTSWGFPGSAAGGTIHGRLPRLVGEHGPEIFLPEGRGTVLPHGQGLGGGSVISVTVNAPNYVGPEESLADPVTRVLQHLVRSGVVAEGTLN